LLAIVVPVVAEGGSLPHSHSSAGPAFFNQDHDRVLLATSGVVAISDASPVSFTLVEGVFAAERASDRVHAATLGTTDSRAPPHA
jgi:hypothetical protein